MRLYRSALFALGSLALLALGCSGSDSSSSPDQLPPDQDQDQDAAVEPDAPVSPDAPSTVDASTQDVQQSPSDAAPADAKPDTSTQPGQVPPDYEAFKDLRDQALINALHGLIDNHHSVGYDGAKGILFKNPGIDNHNGKIECIYTGQLFAPEQLDKGGGYNTEHSWPQSEFGGEDSVAKGDMHHLFPTERTINSCRSSYPFGMISGSPNANCSRGGSSLGHDQSGDNVFMVRPKYRGDIARAHFYFAVRYKLHISRDEETVLRAWHVEDPTDSEETTRNNAIANVQHNRNPFIDWPEAVSLISDF